MSEFLQSSAAEKPENLTSAEIDSAFDAFIAGEPVTDVELEALRVLRPEAFLEETE